LLGGQRAPARNLRRDRLGYRKTSKQFLAPGAEPNRRCAA
jgi:hypothetical protein